MIKFKNFKKKFILGGGSNLLLTKKILGLCIHVNLKGIHKVEENEEQQEEETQQATFSESEREELEAFRKEKKENIISKYAEFLTAEDVAKVTEKISDYSMEELEKELSLLAMQSVMKKQKEESQDSKSDIRAFKIMNGGQEQNSDPVLSLIDKYKD